MRSSLRETSLDLYFLLNVVTELPLIPFYGRIPEEINAVSSNTVHLLSPCQIHDFFSLYNNLLIPVEVSKHTGN